MDDSRPPNSASATYTSRLISQLPHPIINTEGFAVGGFVLTSLPKESSVITYRLPRRFDFVPDAGPESADIISHTLSSKTHYRSTIEK